MSEKKISNSLSPYKVTLSLAPLIESIHESSYIGEDTKKWILNEIQTQAHNYENITEVICGCHNKMGEIFNLVFPPMSMEQIYVAAIAPFNFSPIYSSPPFKKEFMNEKNEFSARYFGEEDLEQLYIKGSVIVILNKLYNTNIDINKIKTLFANSDHIERSMKYFYMLMEDTYCEVIKINPNTQIYSSSEVEEILNNFNDCDYLLKKFPTTDYEFKGIFLLRGTDVTTEIITTRVKERLLKETSISNANLFSYIHQSFKSLLDNGDIDFGLAVFKNDKVYLIDTDCEFKNENIFLDSMSKDISEGIPPSVSTVLNEGLFLNNDLEMANRESDDQVLNHLFKKGARSCLLIRMVAQDEVIGFFQLRSSSKHALGYFDIKLLNELIPTFALTIKRRLDVLDMGVDKILREKCTSIHPSLEWKFQEVAFNYLYDSSSHKYGDLPPITFEEVYPLYAASDIKNSSTIRNESIQFDLLDQLQFISQILTMAYQNRPLSMILELNYEVKKKIENLSKDLNASDEGKVLSFLQLEILPHFDTFKEFSPEIKQFILKYESHIHTETGLIYNKRKTYEDCVLDINNTLSKFLEVKQEEIQKLFPHYFDKSSTDGVDHNIYAGRSLLEDKSLYSDLAIKNLRLWQLICVTQSAVIAHKLKHFLSIPLDMAHIIAAQVTPLNIRFHIDEKKLNVDGAYNARYEIMKKRIDKATIKGKDDRLTSPGHVAIVYTHDNELHEYLKHIQFLKSLNYVVGEIELYDLNDLQGISGLKAIRYKVKLDNVCALLKEYLTKHEQRLLEVNLKQKVA